MAKKETTKVAAAANDPAKAKLNALAQAMGNIEKNFGRGAIMKLGDEQIEDVDVRNSPSSSPTRHRVPIAHSRRHSQVGPGKPAHEWHIPSTLPESKWCPQ